MFAEERRQLIKNLLEKNGSVSTKELSDSFEVSIETVRRDLLQMEQDGLLSRVHGGAVKLGEMRPFHELSVRVTENSDKKLELCRTAALLIDEGDIIFIDAGSTAVCFSQVLHERFENLTVITHSLDVLNILKNKKGIRIILCGGHFDPVENAFTGPLTSQALSTLNVSKAFIFPSTVSLSQGICDHHKDLFVIQQQAVGAADKIFILADSSKFEHRQLLKIADMSAQYTYVTDSALPESLKQMYLGNHLRIITGKDDLI